MSDVRSIEVKERPILCDARAVHGILDGTKTQMRMPVKPQPSARWNAASMHPAMPWVWRFHDSKDYAAGGYKDCPFGQPGDWFWVRETIGLKNNVKFYVADGQPFADKSPLPNPQQIFLWPSHRNTIPSIHMPRWASRITLEITKVRVERVQDITEVDAKADGTALANCGVEDSVGGRPRTIQDYRTGFVGFWNSIYPGSWDRNEWVWVIEFRKL